MDDKIKDSVIVLLMGLQLQGGHNPIWTLLYYPTYICPAATSKIFVSPFHDKNKIVGILDNICIFSIQFKLCYTQRVGQRQFSLHPPQCYYFRFLLDKVVQCCRCHSGTGSMCVARSVGGCDLLRTCLFLAHLVLSISDSVLESWTPSGLGLHLGLLLLSLHPLPLLSWGSAESASHLLQLLTMEWAVPSFYPAACRALSLCSGGEGIQPMSPRS